MGKLRSNSNGLGAVEALLILVIIGIVGFVGWYVVNSYHKTQQLNATATNESNSNTPASHKSLFKTLGISATLPKDLVGLTYSKNNSIKDAEAYDVNVPSFKQLAKQCGASAPVGFATVFKKQGQSSGSPDEGSGTLLKQFNSFYISLGDPLYGNPCQQSVYDQLYNAQQADIQSLKSAFQAAKLIN